MLKPLILAGCVAVALAGCEKVDEPPGQPSTVASPTPVGLTLLAVTPQGCSVYAMAAHQAAYIGSTPLYAAVCPGMGAYRATTVALSR